MNILTTNYTKLFYWLTVADNAKVLFIVFIAIFTAVAAFSTIAFFGNGGSYQSADDKQSQAMARKWMWWSYPFMILFWALYVFTPSKRDALLIVAGGQTLNFLTTDSSTRKIPGEMSGFVLAELKNMAKEAQVELGIYNQKDKILDEAKKMTGEQVLEKMKVDSSFRKILLDK